MSMQFTVVISS